MATRQQPMRSVRQKPVETPSNVFTVEKILNKRIDRNGDEEFLIKWQGFRESESTWEPRANLQCDALISNYERAAKRAQNRKRKHSPEPSPTPSSYEPSPNEPWSNKKVMTIIGLTKAPGDLHFLIKFTDNTDHLVPARDANARYTDEVIAFYESRLALHGITEDEMPIFRM